MTTEDLIKSVDRKLDLLAMDRETLKKVMFGENGTGGLVDDVHDIKKVLKGEPEYDREGLVAIVKRHDEFYKKLQNLNSFTVAMIGLGAGVGGFLTWIVTNGSDILKKIF